MDKIDAEGRKPLPSPAEMLAEIVGSALLLRLARLEKRAGLMSGHRVALDAHRRASAALAAGDEPSARAKVDALVQSIALAIEREEALESARNAA
ncbi:MAG: hypothetical protein AB7P02_12710 [Alphaproteobacteria bacterium]